MDGEDPGLGEINGVVCSGDRVATKFINIRFTSFSVFSSVFLSSSSILDELTELFYTLQQKGK